MINKERIGEQGGKGGHKKWVGVGKEVGREGGRERGKRKKRKRKKKRKEKMRNYKVGGRGIIAGRS